MGLRAAAPVVPRAYSGPAPDEGRRPYGGPPLVTVSRLSVEARSVPDSDDELIGADPDEVAFARGHPGEDSVDWFDVERCVW